LLTSANFTGAVITDAAFYGATKEQLYSTASYRQKNLQGIRLDGPSRGGWDFSGQDLTRASFWARRLRTPIFLLPICGGTEVIRAISDPQYHSRIWGDQRS
jgi:uncharacterized protein YjbI with pentapeptide repeats